MKLKLKAILSTCIFMLAYAAGNAKADSACDLYVAYQYYNFGQPFYPGESFSYNIDIRQHLFPGPINPNADYNHFSIVFHGTGISPSTGEPYPGTYPKGFHNLGGFYNPGGVAGSYERYAVVYWPNNGGVYCTTNTVTVVLM